MNAAIPYSPAIEEIKIKYILIASDIMNMVENAWGLFGASFGPVVILSLFWKRFNYKGAVAGILGGAIADILWLLCFTGTVIEPLIVNTGVYEILPGFIIGAIVAVITTLCTEAPSISRTSSSFAVIARVAEFSSIITAKARSS